MKTLTIFLLLTVPAFAEDFVTYDPATGTYQGCRNYGDTTIPLTDPNNLTTVRPGFLYANPFCTNVLPGVPDKYRKVVAGVVTEMSQAEKDIVDAPALAEVARQATFDVEISGNDLCDATLADIASRIQTIHDTRLATIQASNTTFKSNVDAAAGNIAAMKVQLKDLSDRTTSGFTLVYDDLQTLATKLGKCSRARAR